MKKKVLILTNHRKDRSPGQRFRFEQYIAFLERNGYDIDFSYLLSTNDDKIFYGKGNYLGKLGVFLKSWTLRFILLFTVFRYDIIFVFREAFFTGTVFFEKSYKRFSSAKFIFDFDDSIWIDTVSSSNKKFAWLKNAGKTATLIKLSDLIFAGNDFLADYARQFNKNIAIVPTTIDTDEYTRLENESAGHQICIGWSGSFSTIEHFETVTEALRVLQDKYGNRICFKVIGDAAYKNDMLNIQGIGWNKQDEIRELSSIDIGIMPLPNSEWAKGKCGLKGLQYMALGIPTIMSPVGVNTDIIEDGENGFLASNTADWVFKISKLVDSEKLRIEMGGKGKLTVEKKYSIHANQNLYLNKFNELLASL